MIKNFIQWIEAIAVASNIGNGNFTADNDNDDNDDDWNWEKLNKLLENWTKSSKYANQIKQVLSNELFKSNPNEKIEITGIGNGYAKLMLTWKLDYSKTNDQIVSILLSSDVYKYLQIKPEKIHDLLQKTMLYHYVTNKIAQNMTGNFNLVKANRSFLDKLTSFHAYLFARKYWYNIKTNVAKLAKKEIPRIKYKSVKPLDNDESFNLPLGAAYIKLNYVHAKSIIAIPYIVE